jgi:hypothetical protein
MLEILFIFIDEGVKFYIFLSTKKKFKVVREKTSTFFSFIACKIFEYFDFVVTSDA